MQLLRILKSLVSYYLRNTDQLLCWTLLGTAFHIWLFITKSIPILFAIIVLIWKAISIFCLRKFTHILYWLISTDTTPLPSAPCSGLFNVMKWTISNMTLITFPCHWRIKIFICDWKTFAISAKFAIFKALPAQYEHHFPLFTLPKDERHKWFFLQRHNNGNWYIRRIYAKIIIHNNSKIFLA